MKNTESLYLIIIPILFLLNSCTGPATADSPSETGIAPTTTEVDHPLPANLYTPTTVQLENITHRILDKEYRIGKPANIHPDTLISMGRAMDLMIHSGSEIPKEAEIYYILGSYTVEEPFRFDFTGRYQAYVASKNEEIIVLQFRYKRDSEDGWKKGG